MFQSSESDTTKITRMLILCAVLIGTFVYVMYKYGGFSESREVDKKRFTYNQLADGVKFLGRDTDNGSVFAVNVDVTGENGSTVEPIYIEKDPCFTNKLKDVTTCTVRRIVRCVQGDYTVGFPYYMPRRLQDNILPPATNDAVSAVLSNTNLFVVIGCPVYTNCVVKHYAYIGHYEPTIDELKETIRDLMDRKIKKEKKDAPSTE